MRYDQFQALLAYIDARIEEKYLDMVGTGHTPEDSWVYRSCTDSALRNLKREFGILE